ncbi:MAG: hypothetical protein JNL10_18430 [Verrucomicrobiales bacterium]|nr:hypothetical protein [Verrucomicrobiales bacterium]
MATLGLLLVMRNALGDEPLPEYPLVKVWMERSVDHREEWRAAPPEPRRAGEVPTEAQFRGVFSRLWPGGLVPIYAVELEARVELRRLPMKGRENFSEPLFFALPPADEIDAGRICGRWNLASASKAGRRDRLSMEIAVDGTQVAARLDQETDFRFAFLTGGVWESNRLSVTVEYLNDRYAMTGEESGGVLRGTWRQTPEGDEGIWEAKRPAPTGRIPSPADAVPLFQWTRPADGSRRYLVEGRSPGEGWVREARELCRVWRATNGPRQPKDPVPQPGVNATSGTSAVQSVRAD